MYMSIPRTKSISSQKSSLGFILNEEDDNHLENIDPNSLVHLSTNDFEKKKNDICEFITNKIITIYETTLENQIKSDILRRWRFKNLILLLEYYEKLEVFCNLNLI